MSRISPQDESRLLKCCCKLVQHFDISPSFNSLQASNCSALQSRQSATRLTFRVFFNRTVTWQQVLIDLATQTLNLSSLESFSNMLPTVPGSAFRCWSWDCCQCWSTSRRRTAQANAPWAELWFRRYQMGRGVFNQPFISLSGRSERGKLSSTKCRTEENLCDSKSQQMQMHTNVKQADIKKRNLPIK